MDELSINRTFVRVVDCGGFSAAARALDASVTSVARQVYRLEALLSVRLLNRTTRRQSLTEAGELYYKQITEILRQLDAAKQDIGSYQDAVKGGLRVHLRTSIGNHIVVPALPRLLKRYPDLVLDLTMTDERADLVALGVDVAVWLGTLNDSSLISRRLTIGSRILCASPEYLALRGAPQIPTDLARHNCLLFAGARYGSPWRFVRQGEVCTVPISGNYRTNSSAALVTGALNGIGVAIVQEFLVRRMIKDGSLIHVLPEYQIHGSDAESALYVIYPSGRRLSPKTRVFVDFLVDLFQSGNGETDRFNAAVCPSRVP